MKKSAKFLTAIILIFALLIPGTIAFGYEAGDTVQWKNTYEDYDGETSTTYFYPIYKGEITTGRTEHYTLGDTEEVAFLFTADEAGYYLFCTEDDLCISEKLVAGKPENYKEFFYLRDTANNEYYSSYEAFYFKSGEKQFVRLLNEGNGSNYGNLYIAYAGEINDINPVDDKTYVIGGNIWYYDDEDEDATPTDADYKHEGIIYDFFTISFSDYESDMYVYDIMFKCNDELKNGENKILASEAEFEKEITINCFDVSEYITDVKKVDDTVYEDYKGYHHQNYDGFIVTFADGTTKTVEELEYFEINGIYFYLDSTSICEYDEYEEQYVYSYYIDLIYVYDFDDDSYYECSGYQTPATLKYYSSFKNFFVLMSDIREELNFYFTDLFSGEEPVFSNYMECIRWDIYWFIKSL